MEWSGTFDAHQYRCVAQSLLHLLEITPSGKKLERILTEVPIAAEQYENLRYAHAGLCRSPLTLATEAELLARNALERIRKVHSKK